MNEVNLPEGRYTICEPSSLNWKKFWSFMWTYMTGPARPGVLDVAPKLESAIVPVPYKDKELKLGVLDGMPRVVDAGMGLLGIVPVELCDPKFFRSSFPVVVRGPLTARLDRGLLTVEAGDDAEPERRVSLLLALDSRRAPEIRPSATPEEVVDDVLATAKEYGISGKKALLEIGGRLDSYPAVNVDFNVVINGGDFEVSLVSENGFEACTLTTKAGDNSPKP